MPPRIPGSGYGALAANLSEMLIRYAKSRAANIGPYGIIRSINSIEKTFFSAPKWMLNNVRREGEKARAEGKALMKRLGGGVIDREKTGLDKSLPVGTAYRAVGVVKHTDPITGNSAHRTIIMDFERNPTAEDFKSRAVSQGLQTFTSSPVLDSAGNVVNATENTVELVDILGVYRRTR